MTERLREEIERLSGDDATLVQALERLHAHFVTPDAPMQEGPVYLHDAASLAAYLGWFFPASAAQVERAMNEVAPPPGDVLRVLDVGAGPGPAGCGVASWATRHGRAVRLTALERAPLALASLERLWPFGAGLQTQRWVAGEALPAGPFDVIVVSHVLNELFDAAPDPTAERVRFCGALAERLSPKGLLVLVEPALKRTGRALLEVRDALVRTTDLQVLAPCLTQSPCPALERPRDWCHADRPWTPPDWSLELGRKAGLGRDSLKFAYLVFSLEKAPVYDPDLFRIVSEPAPEKGKKRLFGCGVGGRHALVRLDRKKSALNEAFDTLERGDVVRVAQVDSSGDGLRIGADTRLVVTRSARALDESEP